jgi:hypothetical protein
MPNHYGVNPALTPLLMGAHTAGQRPPILGDPREQQPEDPGQGFMDIVRQLFGGAPNPMLEAQEQERAQKQAMLLAGLQMLAGSSTQEGRAPGLAQILAQGAMTGQQAGMQLQEHAIAQQQQQERLQMREQIFAAVGSGEVSRPQMEQMLLGLLRAGDHEGARSLSEYMKSLGGGSAGRPQIVSDVIGEDGKPYKVMLDQAGNEIRRWPQFETTARGIDRSTSTTKVLHKPSGKVMDVTYDRGTNQYYPAGAGMGVAPLNPDDIAPYSGTPVELNLRAQFMLPQAENAVQMVDAFEGAPDRIARMTAAKGWNEVTPEDQQLLQLAGQALGDTYLRITSGAAIKAEEVEMFISTFLPSPGDTERTIAKKRELRNDIMQGLRTLAARAQALGVDNLGMSREEALRSAGVVPGDGSIDFDKF